jgi:hypothetical protein
VVRQAPTLKVVWAQGWAFAHWLSEKTGITLLADEHEVGLTQRGVRPPSAVTAWTHWFRLATKGFAAPWNVPPTDVWQLLSLK